MSESLPANEVVQRGLKNADYRQHNANNKNTRAWAVALEIYMVL